MFAKVATYDRWMGLCSRLVIPASMATDHYRWLDGKYNGPDRFLHAWDHIDGLLTMLDENRGLATNFDLVEYAAMNHDSEMIFGRKPKGCPTDEALSAVASDGLLIKAGKPFEMRAVSFGLNLATNHKEDSARTTDEMLLADCDWSGLGLPWEQYLANRDKVRREHPYLSDKEFHNARTIWVLKACRRRSHFYLPKFQKLYDARVQENLTREVCEFRMV